MTRHGSPIEEVSLSGSINTGIGYSPSYEQFDALISAGATVTELLNYTEGKFPPWFIGMVVAWYRLRRAIANHQEDAVSKSIKKKSKRKK